MALSEEAQHNLLFVIAGLLFFLFTTGTEASDPASEQSPTVIPSL
jgi:hypothetical protein